MSMNSSKAVSNPTETEPFAEVRIESRSPKSAPRSSPASTVMSDGSKEIGRVRVPLSASKPTLTPSGSTPDPITISMKAWIELTMTARGNRSKPSAMDCASVPMASDARSSSETFSASRRMPSAVAPEIASRAPAWKSALSASIPRPAKSWICRAPSTTDTASAGSSTSH